MNSMISKEECVCAPPCPEWGGVLGLKQMLTAGICLIIAVTGYPQSNAVPASSTWSTSAPTSDQFLGELPCTPFRWLANGKDERGALQVPVELNGKLYWFQLDTGSPDTMLYGDEAVQQGWAKPDANYIEAKTLKIGGVVFSDAELFPYKDLPSGSGTVGLDILMNHYVVIDYPHKRFCVANRLSFPVDIRKRIKWSGASLKRGKIYVHAKVAGEERDDLFLDTGSSQFPVMVEHALWAQVTGKASESDAETKITGIQWGKLKTWPGARAALPIEVAGMVLSHPMVYYEEDGFYRKNFSSAGLLGNAAFWDTVLVLDLGPFMRVGTLQ